MSIGSILQRKIVTARLIGFASFGLFVAGLFLPKGSLSHVLMLLPFAGVAGSHLYIARVAVCPQCKAALPQARIGLGLAPGLRACPACRCDLNAPAKGEA